MFSLHLLLPLDTQHGDLWMYDVFWYILSQAMQREGKDINITQVMDRWTLQMGYPVVTISKNDSLDNSVTISQEHFVYDTDAKIQNPELFNKR